VPHDQGNHTGSTSTSAKSKSLTLRRSR
jgi:hypothetical protein